MIRSVIVLLLVPLAAFGAENADRGGELFQDHCAVCHGQRAEGDGPMALVLSVPPADLTLLSKGNAGDFPLERVLRRVDGSTEVLAHGGPMPLFGPLLGGPSVALEGDIIISQGLADIVAWLRQVQQFYFMQTYPCQSL